MDCRGLCGNNDFKCVYMTSVVLISYVMWYLSLWSNFVLMQLSIDLHRLMPVAYHIDMIWLINVTDVYKF